MYKSVAKLLNGSKYYGAGITTKEVDLVVYVGNLLDYNNAIYNNWRG